MRSLILFILLGSFAGCKEKQIWVEPSGSIQIGVLPSRSEAEFYFKRNSSKTDIITGTSKNYTVFHQYTYMGSDRILWTGIKSERINE